MTHQSKEMQQAIEQAVNSRPIISSDPHDVAEFESWKKTFPHQSLEDIPDATLTQMIVQDEDLYLDETTTVFLIRNNKGMLVAGGQAIKGTSPKYRKRVLELVGVFVHPEYRRHGLARKISTLRETWAKENNIQFAQTHIALTNIPSLLSKFKDGYQMTMFRGDETSNTGGCVLEKNLSKKTQKKEDQEQKIVRLTQVKEIEQLLQQGWVGTKLHGKKDSTSVDTHDWFLILRK